MPVAVKLGKRPAVQDDRVAWFHEVPGLMALAPASSNGSNYFAGPEEAGGWLGASNMGENGIGDCAPVGILNGVTVLNNYAGGPTPTEADALPIYETQGYVPGNDATDLGSQMMGVGGLIPLWASKGFMIGGALNKISAVVKIAPERLMIDGPKALGICNFILPGINLQQIVVAGDSIPYDWPYEQNGAIAGGHLIMSPGCFFINDELYFPVVTWCGRYLFRASSLMAVCDECQAVIDPSALNRAGVNADDLGLPALMAAAKALG
jgi:hypothetical protein